MKKFTFLLLLVPLIGISQEIQYSEPTKFIEKSGYVQVNMSENEKTLFKSGLGESVSFYPSEIIDLKENKKILGLAVESSYIVKDHPNRPTEYTKETAWIGTDEIPDLIIWFENYVIPNMDLASKEKKTVKYIFNTKEIQLKFENYITTQTFTIIIKNSNYKDKYFWTETRVKDIPNILKTLKYLQSKNL